MLALLNSEQEPMCENNKNKSKKQPPQVRKRRPVRYLLTRLLVVVGMFALIGNIPLYSKITSPQSREHLAINQPSYLADSIADKDLAALPLPVAVETYAGYETEPVPATDTGKWHLRTIASGETLADILKPFNLLTSTHELLNDPTARKALSQLKSNRKLLVQVSNRRIEQLIYATGKHKAFIVFRQGNKYTAKWDSESFEEQDQQLAFTIRNPLHYDAAKAGLPTSITRQLVKIFKQDVNFRRIKVGDQVGVIFEGYYYQSEPIYTGNVLAAEFIHRGKTHQRVRLVADSNKSHYLKPDDDLALKEVAFNRYPLKGGRLSSGFGMRKHPVLNKRRRHSGIDLAAPRGTPIYATADGKLRFAGRKGAYGKAVEINHDGGIKTRYGHMSKHKEGLKIGARVKRGDVIGYVGSTGRSTGNHVHYEFIVNGKPQNPQRVKLPTRGILSAKEMKAFKRLSGMMRSRLIKLRDTAALDRNIGRQFGG